MINEIFCDVNYTKKEYTEEEKNLIKELFGILGADIYFKLYVNIRLMGEKFVNFFGLSGSGKTLIKEELKKSLLEQGKRVLDFDDINKDFDEKNKDKTILEIFDIKNNDSELLQILGGFGLFEMRILTTKYQFLSQGQRTRVKYIYLFHLIDNTQYNYILIDEFLTFVDGLSSISFAKTIRKYLKDKKVQVFTFGVNDSIVKNFEDVTFVVGNTKINAMIKPNKEKDFCKENKRAIVTETNFFNF
jgi:ABC-type ATPase with predicted acetyltransferase domain